MISIYWPKKAVPEWLEKIEPTSTTSKIGEIHHGGFGVIVRKRTDFIVFGVSGCFIRILNTQGVRLRGAPYTGGCVFYTTELFEFLRLILRSAPL